MAVFDSPMFYKRNIYVLQLKVRTVQLEIIYLGKPQKNGLF